MSTVRVRDRIRRTASAQGIILRFSVIRAALCALVILLQLTASAQATGPLRVSHINPRYLVSEADTTKAIWLGGFHLWGNALDLGEIHPPTVVGMGKYWDSLTANRSNFVRLWSGWEQPAGLIEAAGDWYWEPMPFLRTGPGLANDGRLKFNLDSLNQQFFDRIRAYCDSLRFRNIYVAVQLFNGWSNSYPNHGYSEGNPWYYHPYNSANNVNEVNGDPNGNGSGEEVHYSPYTGSGVQAVWDHQWNYIKKFIDELNDLDNIFWEVCNEPEGLGEAVAWQTLITDSIHTYEARKPKQHIVWYTAGDFSNDSLFGSPAECVAPSAFVPDGSVWLTNPPDSSGRKVVIQDTDHIWGMLNEDGVPWVWANFCNGNSACLQDNFCSDPSYPGWPCDDPLWYPFKRALGVAIDLSKIADLLHMTPQPDKSSTSDYCLFGSATGEVIVYQDAGDIEVDLSTIPDSVNVIWYDPDDFAAAPETKTAGGGSRTFVRPDPRYQVLYLYDDVSGPGQGPVAASVKVILEGSYDAASRLMNSTLNLNGILAAHFQGVSIPVGAVDSITIELRTAASASASMTRKYKPAWLLRDGMIRSFSDTTKNYVEFDTTRGSYFLVIWHRNHLPVMTSTPQLLAYSIPGVYDFTTSQDKAFGSNPMKPMISPAPPDTTFALVVGDANSDGFVTSTDWNVFYPHFRSGATGYLSCDWNLDGTVTSTDFNLFSPHFRDGKSSQVPP